MAAAATSSLSLLPTTSSSASRTRPSLTVAASLPTSRFLVSPLRGLCFTGAAHPAPKLRCLRSSGKSSRGVFAMAKKCVGDLSEADLKGKKVLLRADLDVPLDDDFKIIDDSRIRAAVRTVKYLIENGARVIICSSLARHRPIMKILGEKPPKGDSPILSLAHLVPRLSELLGIQVVMAEKCIGPDVEKLVASLPEGGVLLLENLKFSKEEEKNEPEFAKKLASLADLYVNDAFRLAFTARASTEGVTKFLKPSVAGLLFQKELNYLVGEVSNPKRPFAVILGGQTVSSAFKTIETCLEKCDFLLLGGAMIFTFYRACGYGVGKSPVEDDIDLAVSILEKAKDKKVSLVLPTDVGIIDRMAGDARFEVVPSNAIPRDWIGVDIGPDSVSTFFKTLDLAKTILWCGALEAVCVRSYSPRTVSIARKLAHLSGKGVTTILGGAYSVGVAESALVTDAMTHATTGARASLELLKGKELPGVLALDEVTPVPTSFV